MPRLVDPVAQRREIVRAARRVFGRRGLKGTGLTHVARAAGMGRSSLYHYYPDKQALVRDLVQDLLAEEEELFASALDEPGPPRERIERLARRLIELFEPWSAVGRLLFDLRSSETARFRVFFRTVREALAAAIAEGQATGEIDAALDPVLAASTIIGAVDGLLLQHFVDARAFPDRDALADALAGAVGKVLRP